VYEFHSLLKDEKGMSTGSHWPARGLDLKGCIEREKLRDEGVVGGEAQLVATEGRSSVPHTKSMWVAPATLRNSGMMPSRPFNR